MLGNNMFAYCGNNPVNYEDISGCFSQTIRETHIDVVGGLSVQSVAWNKVRQYYDSLDLPDVAVTYGRYISLTIGMYNLNATFEKAFDLHGNVQYISSFSFDVTTSASLSASTGYTGSVFFLPDTSYLSGDTYYLGGGLSAAIPYTPLSGTGSINIGRTSDGYFGIMGSVGIAPPSEFSGEVHGGYSYTKAWTPQINIFDAIGIIIDFLT